MLGPVNGLCNLRRDQGVGTMVSIGDNLEVGCGQTPSVGHRVPFTTNVYTIAVVSGSGDRQRRVEMKDAKHTLPIISDSYRNSRVLSFSLRNFHLNRSRSIACATL